MADERTSLLDEVRAARSLPAPETARLIRRAARISQSRLAKAVGVDRTTLARWEAGSTCPRGAQRIRYAELLADLEREISVA
jgi:DNA-binding transcriptional regulator YiaG